MKLLIVHDHLIEYKNPVVVRLGNGVGSRGSEKAVEGIKEGIANVILGTKNARKGAKGDELSIIYARVDARSTEVSARNIDTQILILFEGH
ncbi:hypothetical protein Ancab_020398 [Ancistrocladus abbreviatus]